MKEKLLLNGVNYEGLYDDLTNELVEVKKDKNTTKVSPLASMFNLYSLCAEFGHFKAITARQSFVSLNWSRSTTAKYN